MGGDHFNIRRDHISRQIFATGDALVACAFRTSESEFCIGWLHHLNPLSQKSGQSGGSSSSMRPTSKSKGNGITSTARRIPQAKRLILCSAQKETREPPNGSSARCSSFRNIHPRESST